MKLIELNTNEISKIKEYLELSESGFCDYTIGVRLIWQKAFKIKYAIINQTLIMQEKSNELLAFYFPLGKDIDNALSKIEDYCVENDLPLCFCYLTDKEVDYLKEKYPTKEPYFLRDWSDYIYPSSQFLNYSGKKLAGQRNHLNKFNKLYQNCSFEILDKKNLNDVLSFLEEFEHTTSYKSWSKVEESKTIIDFTKTCLDYNQHGLLIRIDGKVEGLSIGETQKNMEIIHIEKANTIYEGIYPTLANAYAKQFCQNVELINREEDCGDQGLRTSKLQYHPCSILNKQIIEVKKFFPNKIEIQTQRLTLNDITLDDAKNYYKLCSDEDLNKLWGYDYKEDNQNPTETYFVEFANKLKETKLEYDLAIRLNGKLIGEIALWHFGYHQDLEIGFRLLKAYQQKGYATEAVQSVCDYCFSNLNTKTIKARCFIENKNSQKLLKKMSFKRSETDGRLYFFEKKI